MKERDHLRAGRRRAVERCRRDARTRGRSRGTGRCAGCRRPAAPAGLTMVTSIGRFSDQSSCSIRVTNLTVHDTHDIAFEMAVSSIRFGKGVTREVGMDLAELGAKHVLVSTDPTLRSLPPVQTVIESLDANKIRYDDLRSRARRADRRVVSRCDRLRERDGGYDAFVAVGGGSTIDTAKAVNLYTTYPPADFLDYVNPPIGKGLPVPGPLKPLIAIPTTAGTGSETTGVSIFDLTRLHAKTGIANRRLEADARRARSGQHADDAAGGGGVERPRHSQPRDRIVHGDAVHRPAAARTARRCGRRIRDRIRSAMCGRCRRCGWWRSISCARSPIRRTTRRDRRCCSRRRMRASDSAMPACTCRTACRIRCRAT